MGQKILEYNNGTGYRRGVSVKDQPKSLASQDRIMVYLLDEDFELVKNIKGGNVVALFVISKSTTIGFQD